MAIRIIDKILGKFCSNFEPAIHGGANSIAYPFCCSTKHKIKPARLGGEGSYLMRALGLVWQSVDVLDAEIEETRTELREPTQFGSKLVFDHWNSAKARGGFVVGRDVPSRTLACALRNLALFEPVDDMSDFRVRLAGTAFTRRFGREATGLKLSEIFDRAQFRKRLAQLKTVIGRAQPAVAEVKLEREGRVFGHFEELEFPVLSPHRNAVWVLSGLFYFDWA
jgi:hypothetical protein